MQPNKANLDQLREKIDALAAMPGSSKFLVVREASYADILAKVQSPARAEAYLRKLAEHDDKAVAEMAKKELDFLEVKKAPLDFKATTLDGKEVDLAQLRGKVVALYFWSFTNQNATKGLDALQEVYSFNRKAGFEVVTVSTDKAEDREKLAKYVKENRLNFPVVFDGKGSKTDIAQKLNTTSVPRLTLLDRQGMILTVNLPLNQLDAAVKQYTAKGK